MKLFPYDPFDTYENSLIGKPTIPSFCPKMIMKVQDSQTLSTNTDPYSTVPSHSKALPSIIDYERLSPYFAFRPHDVIQNTLRQTPQLTKSTIHYPMRCHLKSRFQMLRHKRLNEFIATAIYFACERSIK
jgi:hypothetical protein